MSEFAASRERLDPNDENVVVVADSSRARSHLHTLGFGFLLLISLVLRVAIAVRGGQFFWTDEGSRYGVSREAVDDFLKGHSRAGWDALFSAADHLLFKVIGIIPAFLERLFGNAPWVAGIFFGGFSLLLIYLVWRLVLRLGGSTTEALCSSLLMASCNGFFYYARHVFPYDLALCFFMAAALRGLRVGSHHAFTAGVLAGLGYLSYNGYWLFGAVTLVLLSFSQRGSWRRFVAQAALRFVGLITPIALVIAIGRLLGHDLVKSSIEFSIGNKLGDFGTTWRFVFDYLWSAEKEIVVYWALAFIAASIALFKGRLDSRVKGWLSGAVLFYLGLVVPSDVLKTFTVFARQVRPLEIFLCLIGGWYLSKLIQSSPLSRTVAGLISLGVVVCAGLNFRAPILQEFPPEFERRAQAIVQKELEKDGGIYRIRLNPSTDEIDPLGSERPVKVLKRSKHPLQFRPYLLEGYSRDKRTEFLARDMTMRVEQVLPERPEGRTQLSKSDGVWAPGLWTPYPGAMQIDFLFDPKHRASPQPIVSGGVTGAGDELSVEFINAHTLRFALDHWGVGAIYSAPVEYDFEKPHSLVVSFGTLYPPETDAHFLNTPEWARLKHTVFVRFDGVTVISRAGDFFPASPQSITLFHNLLGFGTAVVDFPGRILSVSPVAPSEVITELK